MQASFWHQKWQSNQIGFHQDEVNKILLKHWPVMQLPKGAQVLVPLCGKSLDLVWLRGQGYGVIGIELSEIALDELAASLQQRLGIEVTKESTNITGLSAIYRAEGVLLLAGDIFAVSQNLIGPVAAIYDRAALVALPADMRVSYCKHLHVISQAAPQLLLSFDYDQSVYAGPPFSVPAAEIHFNYQAFYQQFDLLEIREIIEHEPKFRERGLNSFKQLVYRIS